jgi:hypothetical protein
MEKRLFLVCAAVLAQGCSSDNPVTGEPVDGSAGDSSSPDVAVTPDTGTVADSSAGGDGAVPDSAAADGAVADADAGTSPGSDASCPATWLAAPVVDPSIAVPDGGGGVILHAAAAGTQDYTCTSSTIDAGGGADGGQAFGWVFVGPEADLQDCNSAVFGHHQASDAGAGFPEWIETSDGTYVVGQKVAAFTPDGGAASVPWLLLHAVAHGGTGTLSQAQYVQRVNTDGGVAPSSSSCATGTLGTTQKVPYTADYYFFGP